MPHNQVSCHAGIDLVKIVVLQDGLNIGDDFCHFFLKGGQNRYTLKLRG